MQCQEDEGYFVTLSNFEGPHKHPMSPLRKSRHPVVRHERLSG